MSKVLSIDTETENEINLMAEDGVNHAFIAQQLSVSRAAVSQCIQIKKDKMEPTSQNPKSTEGVAFRELPESGKRNVKKEKAESDKEATELGKRNMKKEKTEVEKELPESGKRNVKKEKADPEKELPESGKRNVKKEKADSDNGEKTQSTRKRSLPPSLSEASKKMKVRKNCSKVADEKLLKQFRITQFLKVTVEKLSEQRVQELLLPLRQSSTTTTTKSRKRKSTSSKETSTRKRTKSSTTTTPRTKKCLNNTEQQSSKQSKVPQIDTPTTTTPVQEKELLSSNKKKKVRNKVDNKKTTGSSAKINSKADKRKRTYKKISNKVKKESDDVKLKDQTKTRLSSPNSQDNQEEESGTDSRITNQNSFKSKKVLFPKGGGSDAKESTSLQKAPQEIEPLPPVSLSNKLSNEEAREAGEKKSVTEETSLVQTAVVFPPEQSVVVKEISKEQNTVMKEPSPSNLRAVKTHPQEPPSIANENISQALKEISLENEVFKETPLIEAAIHEASRGESEVKKLRQVKNTPVEREVKKSIHIKDRTQKTPQENEAKRPPRQVRKSTKKIPGGENQSLEKSPKIKNIVHEIPPLKKSIVKGNKKENDVKSESVDKGNTNKECSMKKVNFLEEELVDDFVYGTPKYAILDIEKLKRGFENLVCSKCYKSIDVKFPSSMEVPDTEFQVKCPSCNRIKCFKRSQSCIDEISANAIGYDSLYMRLIFSSLDFGGGYRQMESMCLSLGIPHINLKTYRKHCNFIIQQSKVKLEGMLKTAGDSVHRVYSDAGTQPDEEGVRNIDVTYDGTWIQRGRHSKYGLVVAVDLVTGLVLDYHLMSKYCLKCFLAKKKNPCTFEAWRSKHKELGQCRINYESSPEDMEVDGALILCQRSIQRHKLRYNNLSSRDEGNFEGLEMAVQKILNNAKVDNNGGNKEPADNCDEYHLRNELLQPNENQVTDNTEPSPMFETEGGQNGSSDVGEQDIFINQVENKNDSPAEGAVEEVIENHLSPLQDLGVIDHIETQSLSSDIEHPLGGSSLEVSQLTLDSADQVLVNSDHLLEPEALMMNRIQAESPFIKDGKEHDSSLTISKDINFSQIRLEDVISQAEKENYPFVSNQEPVKIGELGYLSEVRGQESLKIEEKTSLFFDTPKLDVICSKQSMKSVEEQEILSQKHNNSTQDGGGNEAIMNSDHKQLEDSLCLKKSTIFQEDLSGESHQEDILCVVEGQESLKGTEREKVFLETQEINKTVEEENILAGRTTTSNNEIKQVSELAKNNNSDTLQEEEFKQSLEKEERSLETGAHTVDTRLCEVGVEGKASDIFLEIQNFVTAVEQSETSKQGVSSILGNQTTHHSPSPICNSSDSPPKNNNSFGTENEQLIQPLDEDLEEEIPTLGNFSLENEIGGEICIAKTNGNVSLNSMNSSKDDDDELNCISDKDNVSKKDETRDESVVTTNDYVNTNGHEEPTAAEAADFDIDNLVETSFSNKPEEASNGPMSEVEVPKDATKPMEVESGIVNNKSVDCVSASSNSIPCDKELVVGDSGNKECVEEEEKEEDQSGVDSRLNKGSSEDNKGNTTRNDVQKALRKIKSETLRSIVWKKCNQTKVIPWECVEFACYYAIITHNVGIQNFIKCNRF